MTPEATHRGFYILTTLSAVLVLVLVGSFWLG